jgi:hypothetical protein
MYLQNDYLLDSFTNVCGKRSEQEDEVSNKHNIHTQHFLHSVLQISPQTFLDVNFE